MDEGTGTGAPEETQLKQVRSDRPRVVLNSDGHLQIFACLLQAASYYWEAVRILSSRGQSLPLHEDSVHFGII